MRPLDDEKHFYLTENIEKLSFTTFLKLFLAKKNLLCRKAPRATLDVGKMFFLAELF